jgi:chemotaxis protein MotB
MYGSSNVGRKAPSRGQPAPRPRVGPANVIAASPQITSDDGNWWMITLSDLTLLLLGFLVLWYVTDKKVPAATQSTAVVAAPSVEQTAAPAAAPIPTAVQPDEWKKFRDDMKEVIGAAGLTKDVTVEFAQNEIVLSLKDTLPFDSGKADLRPQAFPVLEKVGAMLLVHPLLSLEVSGHTDDVPIATAAFPSNWELSSARASRVARYLIEEGVDPSRIAVQGFADQRPRAADSSPAMRSTNRRVELRLYHNAARPSSPTSDTPAS